MSFPISALNVTLVDAAQIILSFERKFFSIVFLYPHVVLHHQLSTFTITQIFLRISNIQHVSPKL